jgi:hypothetical protein
MTVGAVDLGTAPRRKGYGPPCCFITLQEGDQFARLPMTVHGAPRVTLGGRLFVKSGQRTDGGWLIYREKRA